MMKEVENMPKWLTMWIEITGENKNEAVENRGSQME